MASTDQFSRDMGCTEAEWLRWLQPAAGDHALAVDHAQRRAVIAIGAGRCRLSWAPQPDRRIALMCIPRLAVSFEFEGVGDSDRTAFLAQLRSAHAARRRLDASHQAAVA